ncbi:MAG: dCTP deaminase [Blastocatellia bacterium]|jgi:deoxycytidine triphosphate deaminase|nr:dCTP deaminase [Blastocatellia bacterium]
MAVMITGEDLRKMVTEGTLIASGDLSCAEGVKYDLRLSQRILKAKFRRPINANELSVSERRDLVIEPGEVVFVLSEERLTLPTDVIAQLSPKRKLSHAGILTLGGFTIDPGYVGHLLVGLFNLSATPFDLIPGKKLVGATFHRLTTEEIGDFPPPGAPLDDFPDELIQVMQKYQPMASQAVLEQVKKLQSDLDRLQTDIRTHDEWYRRFEGLLEGHDKQITNLLTGLTTEKEAREKGEDKLSTMVTKIDRKLWWLQGAAWAIFGVIIFVAVPLFVTWAAKKFF